jgi:hypothetical protein
VVAVMGSRIFAVISLIVAIMALVYSIYVQQLVQRRVVLRAHAEALEQR